MRLGLKFFVKKSVDDPLDHFCSHWSIKLPMKFSALIMRYTIIFIPAMCFYKWWCSLMDAQLLLSCCLSMCLKQQSQKEAVKKHGLVFQFSNRSLRGGCTAVPVSTSQKWNSQSNEIWPEYSTPILPHSQNHLFLCTSDYLGHAKTCKCHLHIASDF